MKPVKERLIGKPTIAPAHLFGWWFGGPDHTIDLDKYEHLMSEKGMEASAIERALESLSDIMINICPAGTHLLITSDGSVYGCTPTMNKDDD